MAEEMEQWLKELLQSDEGQATMTAKQKRIVEAAVEIFAEKGFAATSTSEIAQRAGVAEGTIFRHYNTKKDLLLAIIAPTMIQLMGPLLLRDFRKVVDAEYAHFEDFLRTMIKNRLEFAVSNVSALKIVLHELPFHPELRHQFMNTMFPKVSGRLENIITHFQEQGELIKMPPLTLLRMIVSSTAGYILTRALIAPDNEWDDEQEIETTVQYIMHGLTPEP